MSDSTFFTVCYDHSILRMKHLYHHDRKLFQQLVEQSPIGCAINTVQDFHWLYANRSFLEMLELDSKLLLSQGFLYTKPFIHPQNLHYQLQLLKDYASIAPPDSAVNYYQYCRPSHTQEYRWIYTQKIFLTDTLYLSFYLDLSMFKGLYQFLLPYLQDLLTDPFCYEKFRLLTSREKELIKHINKGYTNKQIGELFFISEHTVRTHRNNIWKKLEIGHAHELIKFDLLQQETVFAL
jgi:DNA-binding CsgD family transcriptional regulator